MHTQDNSTWPHAHCTKYKISSLFMQPYCAESMSNPSSFTSRIKYLAAVTKKRQSFDTEMGVTQIFCMFSVYSCHMSAESRQWEALCWSSLSKSVSNRVTLCCNAIRFLSALPCVCWCFLLRFLRSDHSTLLVNHKLCQCAQLLLDSLSSHVTISLFSMAH